MLTRFFTVVGLAILLSGCVVYPSSRTYLAPNPDDGTLSRSQGCGYQKTKLDTLSRKTKDYYLEVKPNNSNEHSFYVHVYVQSEKDIISLNASKVVILVNGKPQEPEHFTVDKRQPRRGSEYYSAFINIFYPTNFDSIQTLSVEFGESMKLNGSPEEQTPFRFEKQTVSDFYMASINC
ncbi:hypothetical protein [Veronia pacifica]|uniref:Lipoprotein n=1 Tax=Veronia pacifica TaxID=1080227 RepID=A0A1C3ESF2_9GAMM|nr:hypothetical protein [Veronia pacifica]ODA36227.1 hypothetical protein A8L45_01080 [Veronia pacifica]